MRRVAVVTTSRADYGIYRPVLRALARRPELEPVLLVSGAHLSEEHGGTVADIERDGWPIAARIELPLDDTTFGVTRATAAALVGFGEAYRDAQPDLVLVLGDRYEMHAAALAALPARIPVAHLHGGERSEGAFDEALRHGITKLSHIHLTSTEDSARRVVQLGEEPWRVTVTGAPSIDALLSEPRLAAPELASLLGVPFDPAPVLVALHPATLGGDPKNDADALAGALAVVDRPLVITAPNADPGGRAIRARFEALVAERPDAVLRSHLGDAYRSVLAAAAVLVGNSSSGIIEAATFGLPVVNIGARQDGRVRARNVIDVAAQRDAIVAGLDAALEPGFRDGLADLENPYGDGHASDRIAERLATTPLDQALLMKRFHDLPGASS